MNISEKDKTILCQLAEQQAEIAILPIHKQTIAGWKRINNLQKGKPMIWINEIPWHEMDVNGELTLQTEHPFCRTHEQILRRTIYQWRHMPGDMVVEPVFYSPLVIRDTGFGISEAVDIVQTDERNNVVSRHFHPQIQNEEDLEKIKEPRVTYDAETTERNYQCLVDLIGDILSIEKRGHPGFWFAPWDELIRWWGVQEALMDLILRPDLVHKTMERLISAYLSRLDQYEALGLLSLNDNNVRVGSGGLGYVDQLPQPDYNPDKARAADLWGCATAQIFGSVSPQMHEEFALQYERRWLERFGLTYYGCCEPLHTKIEILQTIPNLRKVSMSPWVEIDTAVKNVGDQYVFSRKPNPAIFAEDTWNPERVRRDLVDLLEKTQDCVVEIIMKDLSTVRYEPQRLWEWSDIAKEVTAEFAWKLV